MPYACENCVRNTSIMANRMALKKIPICIFLFPFPLCVSGKKNMILMVTHWMFDKMYSTWQADILHRIVQGVTRYLQTRLEQECFPTRKFNVVMFGSLQQGLFIPMHSKINIDISPTGMRFVKRFPARRSRHRRTGISGPPHACSARAVSSARCYTY